MLKFNDGATIKQIVQNLKTIGYYVSYKLLLTADFGVLQKMRRVIIISTRKDILPNFNFEILSKHNTE